MARISIEPVRAKNTLDRQSGLEKTLNGLYQEVESVRIGLNFKIAGQEALASRLQAAAKQISKESASTRAMRSGLEQVIARYEQTESGNQDRLGAEKTSVQQAVGAIVAQTVQGVLQNAEYTNWLFGLAGIVALGAGGVGGAVTIPSDLFTTKFKSGATVNLKKAFKDGGGFFKKVSDFEDGHSEKVGGKFYFDPKTKTFTEVDEKDKDALDEFKKHNKGTLPIDFKMAGVGTSASISAYSLSGEATGGLGGVKGSVDLAKLEGNASAYIGLLGVGASAGASFTAFSAEEQAYLGTEDLQIYEKIGVSAGKLEAKGDISLGLIDKEGNFNPSAYAGVSAEAIAGEVSGSVGVKALGADVAVKGSLNYGIGAHANVGIHDGKISLDVGATLGVGASVKLDIDVSGTVKAIGDTVGNVASGVGKFFGSIMPW